MMQSYPLTHFRCGHTGRNNEGSSRRRKVTAFIRIAELRQSRVEGSPKNCPDCGKGKS